MAILYKSGSVREFYRRRASRLLPAYFATIIATVTISAFLTLPSEHAQVVKQGIFASAFASNIGFWAQHSYFSKADFNPLLHLWTLGVEIQFYLIVPIIAWLHMRSRTLLLLLGLGSLIAALFMVTISPKTAFFIMPFRLWQFLAGAGVAWYLTQNGASRYPKPSVGLLALLVLLLTVIIYPVDGLADSAVIGHPGLAAFIITAATAAILAFGLPRYLEQSLLGTVLHSLGSWSYSIYLAHFPVIVLALYVPFSGTILSPSGWEQTFALLTGIAASSTLLYLMFDKRRMWSGSLAATGVLICLTASASLLSAPLSSVQYNNAEMNILSASSDRAHYRCGKLFRILNPRALICELTQGLPDTAPALLLAGDSHADAIKTSFTQVAQERGYRLYLTVSNAPVYGYPGTTELIEQATAISADGIILHYASSNAIRAFAKGFHNSSREEGPDVVWVLPVPIFERSVPSMIWDERDNLFSLQVDPINLSEISKLAADLLAANIPVFDPQPILCSDGCTLTDEKMRPLYFDSGHLTLTGAKKLEDLLEASVDWFKNRHAPLPGATEVGLK